MWGSLLSRVAFFLTIALFPIGILAVAQTWRAIDASQESFEASLRAQTSSIATPEREAIMKAFGIARGVAAAIGTLDPEAEECDALMRNVALQNPQFLFAGVVENGFVSRCNARGEVHDFSGTPQTLRLFADPEPAVTFSPRGEATGLPVIIVSEPVYGPEGDFQGFVSLSFPPRDLSPETRRAENPEGAVVAVFNVHGELLTSNVPAERAGAYLPLGSPLTDLVGRGEFSFTGYSRSGQERVFAVVPIVAEQAYAIGSWQPQAAGDRIGSVLEMSTVAAPVLMWLVGLLVAVIALDRLVVRYVKELGRRMRSFAEGRRIFRAEAIRRAPTEIRDIGETFERMAQKITRDEADLENALHEREVLLKEVHHRVKNNLQLMSSIINMQIRQLQSPEARDALRRFQERIGSLASVHRGLYQSGSLAHMRVDTLIDELVSQLGALGATEGAELRVTRDLAPITLVPDQAAPLAMLTAEAMTNALKYGGPDASGRFEVHVLLAQDNGQEAGDPAQVRLEISNTLTPDAPPIEGGGIGQQLIAAFAAQLGAELSEDRETGRHVVRVVFRSVPFDPEAE